MRVLITGANGFIGRYLVDKLASTHEVIAAVRTDTVFPQGVEVRVIPSIDSQSDWVGLLSDIDVVVHLAARVHVMNESAEDPLSEFREVNALGTSKLAGAAAEQGVKRFVFMSSIKANGEGNSHAPYSDTDVPAPVDPYGVSKWEAEQLVTSVGNETGMEIVILRAPVVYGPGVRGNIKRLSQLVRLGLPLPFGAVNNRRTMLSLQNLGVWVGRAISEASPPERAVLMGDPSPVSTRVLVEELALGMGKRAILLPIPVSLMERVARLIGKEQITQRLFSDLEVRPSFQAFQGIESELAPENQSIQEAGAAFGLRN
ncbi:NAD dependent epimerase/dehydratase family protein [Corynebacterium efficiens YS-314]|uniref:Putative UDP-galactose 4-epimerase n=1 Tax=Corynebacterium efficiens (strain DSM 44549 / YS-314 / AJ 12310 / JCM 11189 / NBRC 100395) TaxID=196164 RepID=Q8FSM1_COREF|nr:SDR family oxidoreductase [Corynebacterium efficiens]EEW50933.1 NAD dependent epimerase/dehydratase family protein [Corynebacterium efficiens YS-314]BAC17172.1 putative UDP-galactose 4-epimerase [Corynebacterium efficiens YS-314]